MIENSLADKYNYFLDGQNFWLQYLIDILSFSSVFVDNFMRIWMP